MQVILSSSRSSVLLSSSSLLLLCPWTPSRVSSSTIDSSSFSRSLNYWYCLPQTLPKVEDETNRNRNRTVETLRYLLLFERSFFV